MRWMPCSLSARLPWRGLHNAGVRFLTNVLNCEFRGLNKNLYIKNKPIAPRLVLVAGGGCVERVCAAERASGWHGTHQARCASVRTTCDAEKAQTRPGSLVEMPHDVLPPPLPCRHAALSESAPPNALAGGTAHTKPVAPPYAPRAMLKCSRRNEYGRKHSQTFRRTCHSMPGSCRGGGLPG